MPAGYERSTSQTSTTTLDDISYTSTANQLTGYLYSEVEGFCNAEQSAEQAAEQAADKAGNVGKWRDGGVKKGVRIYRTSSDFQNKTPCMLGRIKIKSQPAYLASYLHNPQTRFYYDNSFKETKLLQTVNDNIKLYYTVFQTKKCLVNYNVSICNIAAHRKEGETHITGYCSVPTHKNMIVETGVPTIWVHYSGFVIKPGITEDGVNCSDVFYIFQFDYKGELPTFVINFALDRQMTQLANIKVVLEKCLLSPGYSDSGDSLSTVGLSRQNSETSGSNSDCSRNLIRLPSTSSLGSIGMGRRTGIQRVDSFSSAHSFVISNSNSSPPLSMKSFSEPYLTKDDPLVAFYVDSEDEQSIRSSQESLMQSIIMQGEQLPQSLVGNLAFSSQNSIASTSSECSTFMEHQYELNAKRASAELYKEYVGIIESVRFSSTSHSSLPWKVIDQKRGVWILENTDADKLHICGVTRVNTDCDTLVNYLNDLNSKIEYDRFLHKAMIVDEINEELQIMYAQFKTKHCLMVQYERDACVFQYLCRKDKKALLVSSSVTHPSCPPEKNVTRLTVDLTGFIVEALADDPNQCSLVYVLKAGMGPGYFPHSLLWLIKRRQPLLLARIASHFKAEK